VASVDVDTLRRGSFFPTIAWTPPRENAIPIIVWFEMLTDDEGNLSIDLDLALQSKYKLSAKQASSSRLQRKSKDNKFASMLFQGQKVDGIPTWCVHTELLNRVLQWFTRKKDAEAERMYEHRRAQRFIETGICEIEVVCKTCEAVDRMTPCGVRVCEYPWNAYKLDVAIVFGGSVVGAVEVLNTCPVSNKKVHDMTSHGLQWAEVRATDIISASSEKSCVVRAIRGGGVCQECNHQETYAILSKKMSENIARQQHVDKRRLELEAESQSIGIENRDLKTKIRKLIV